MVMLVVVVVAMLVGVGKVEISGVESRVPMCLGSRGDSVLF